MNALELASPLPMSNLRTKVSDLLELTKPRITFFVVMTAFVAPLNIVLRPVGNATVGV